MEKTLEEMYRLAWTAAEDAQAELQRALIQGTPNPAYLANVQSTMAEFLRLAAQLTEERLREESAGDEDG